MEFQCNKCDSNSLYVVREETTSTSIDYDENAPDFEYGREEVTDCGSCEVQCGEGHTLTLKDGNVVSDFDDFKKWISERNPGE